MDRESAMPLAPETVGVGQCETCAAGQQAGTPEEERPLPPRRPPCFSLQPFSAL